MTSCRSLQSEVLAFIGRIDGKNLVAVHVPVASDMLLSIDLTLVSETGGFVPVPTVTHGAGGGASDAGDRRQNKLTKQAK